MTDITLDSPEVRQLQNMIKDSFRVRQNDRPLYVDIGGHLARIGAAQHQVIFGRRGSGKSCLLVHYLNESRPSDVLPVYVLADEYKRLTYPDILIRLLIEILEALPVRARVVRRLTGRDAATVRLAGELRKLLDMAEESEVVEAFQQGSSELVGAGLGRPGMASVNVGMTTDSTRGKTSTFKERKLDTLERHLRDYKAAISDSIRSAGRRRGCLLIDDFYLIPREWHPDVLDYLHRLLRDTEMYMKVATIRHRTQLLRNHPQTVGLELSQDVEEISLDWTLEDLEATQEYLGKMLASMASRAGIPDALTQLFNADGLQELTLASGGVPRDFLNTFVTAVDASVSERSTRWLTPKYIYKGAGRLAYQTKLRNLREDASADSAGLDRLLHDLLAFCLQEKRKTAFLVSQDEAQRFPREHELIQQLMDFKLIHIVEPDTSAASGRPGRYEAYTLDFSLFMEPRRRGIEIVEFWKIDENRRRTGIREAPTYSLERAGRVLEENGGLVSPEEILEGEAVRDSGDVDPLPPPVQPSLFS